MSTLRDYLKDHPLVVMLGTLASIATILGFLLLLINEYNTRFAEKPETNFPVADTSIIKGNDYKKDVSPPEHSQPTNNISKSNSEDVPQKDINTITPNVTEPTITQREPAVSPIVNVPNAPTSVPKCAVTIKNLHKQTNNFLGDQNAPVVFRIPKNENSIQAGDYYYLRVNTNETKKLMNLNPGIYDYEARRFNPNAPNGWSDGNELVANGQIELSLQEVDTITIY
jgi:cytoskeletal protein RodZ